MRVDKLSIIVRVLEPNTSLQVARISKAKLKPIPNPRASRRLLNTFSLEAKPKALPKTIQFTTIKGI